MRFLLAAFAAIIGTGAEATPPSGRNGELQPATTSDERSELAAAGSQARQTPGTRPPKSDRVAPRGPDQTPPQIDWITPDPGLWVVDQYGLDEIQMSFNEDVVIPVGAIKVWKSPFIIFTDYATSYDPKSRILTVCLDPPIQAERLTLVLDYTITDLAGNELDGEIAVPADPSLPSGDGIRGGQAVFRFNVLQGDATRDGVVDSLDGNAIAASLGRCTNDEGFDPKADLNLDGCVNIGDAAIYFLGQGGTLPATDGVPPIVTEVRQPSAKLFYVWDEMRIRCSELVVDNQGLDGTLYMIDRSGNLLRPETAFFAVGELRYRFDALQTPCDEYTMNISNALHGAGGELLIVPAGHWVSTGLVPPPAPELDPHTTSTSASSVTITGNAVGANEVEVVGPNGTSTAPTTFGIFSVDVPLAGAGENRANQIFITGLSQCGGTRSPPARTVITHDAEPPSLFIDFPANGADITTATIDVAGRVGDMLSGFMGLEVEVVVRDAMGAPVTPLPVPADVDVGIGNNGTFFASGLPLAPNQTNTIEVAVADSLSNATTKQITVTHVPIPPLTPQMVVLSGNNQEKEIGGVLDAPIVVRMTHADGTTPFVSKVVTFKVTRSNGRLGATAAELIPAPGNMDPGSMMYQVRTDANGEALAYWRLGTDAGCGNNRVEVTSMSIAGTVAFCASALPGPVKQINIGSGNNQRGEAGSPAMEPLRVWVSDGCNGIDDVQVQFTVTRGGGTVNGQDSVVVPTSVTGHAEVSFTLGPEQGNNVIEATLPAFPMLQPARFVIYGLVRGEKAQATTFSGIVLNNAFQPIQGATCRLAVGSVFMPDTVSDIEGRFSFDNVTGSGKTDLYVDGSSAFHVGGSNCTEPECDVVPGTYPSLHYETLTVPHADNSLPTPVLLPPLNPNNGVVYDGEQTDDVELTCEGMDGLKMIVRAGTTITLYDGTKIGPNDPGTLTLALNQVHHDDIPMPIPDGASPPFAWTLQPGGAHFDPPIEIVYPNMSGLPPGAIAYFMSFNHDTARFEIIASGQVSDDGSVITTDPGMGLSVAGWGCNCPPYSVTGDCCSGCEAACCEGTCCNCACCAGECCDGECCVGGKCCGGECCSDCCGGECCKDGKKCCSGECCADCCDGKCCKTKCCEGLCCPDGTKTCCDGECCRGPCCEDIGLCCAPTDKSCCDNKCCAGPCCENTGECCPADKESCCDNECCDGPCCNNQCCPHTGGSCCATAPDGCCPPGRECCDTGCCQPGWTCCDGECCPGPCCENTGECCAQTDKSCCNDMCCPGPCCQNTGQCCPITAESCCSNQCCNGPCCDNQCCQLTGGKCCSTAPGGCCAGNQLCCEATGGGCCPSGTRCCGTGADECCPVGIVCCNRRCCPAGEKCCSGDFCCKPTKCCNDECCADSELCCDGTCEVPNCSLTLDPGMICPGGSVELTGVAICEPKCATMSLPPGSGKKRR